MSQSISTISASLNKGDNPKWPPIRGKYLAVRRGDQNKMYIGSVRASNTTEAVIHLVRPFRNIDEYSEVRPYIPNDKDPERFYLVIESDTWKYVDSEDIARIKRTYQEPFSNLSGREALITDSRDRGSTLLTTEYGDADEEPNVDAKITDLIDLCNISGFEFLYKHPDGMNIEGIDRVYQTEDDLIIDEKVDNYAKELYESLDSARYCEPEEIKPVDHQMISKLVTSEITLRREGENIIDAIKNRLIHSEDNEDKLFSSLRLIYHDGWVHVLRDGIPINEIITRELLQSNCNECKLGEHGEEEEEEPTTNDPNDPNLEKLENPLICLDWQYDRPIDHNQLKFILYGADSAFAQDRGRVLEAELILSQEYIIALTPEPRYQLWTLLRLIQIWYADPILKREVRMIKYLVNSYRARTDKTYNQENGINFVIGVFPRYGKASAVRVVQRLAYWFSLYTSAIAWKNNAPSYFKLMNDLISYTNSNQALKLYYRRLIQKPGQENRIFKNKYSLMNDNTQGSRDILHQYMPIDRYE